MSYVVTDRHDSGYLSQAIDRTNWIDSVRLKHVIMHGEYQAGARRRLGQRRHKQRSVEYFHHVVALGGKRCGSVGAVLRRTAGCVDPNVGDAILLFAAGERRV